MQRIKRDIVSGSLLGLIGACAVLEGRTYRVGSLTHMGPGFMPVSLGFILIFLGLLVAGSALAGEGDNEPIFRNKPQWLPWLCIIAGPVSFIVLGIYGGLVPATFACVFMSAFADRTATVRGSFVLAVASTLFAAIVFGYLLQVQLPLFQWG